jgi:hypothetical protein
MLPILRILPVGGVLLAILILVLALSPPDGARPPLNTTIAPARGALVVREHHPETRQFLIMAALKRADELNRLRDLPDTPTRTEIPMPEALQPEAPQADAAQPEASGSEPVASEPAPQEAKVEPKVAGLPGDRIDADPEEMPSAVETPSVSIPVEVSEPAAEPPAAAKPAPEKTEQTKVQQEPRRRVHRAHRSKASARTPARPFNLFEALFGGQQYQQQQQQQAAQQSTQYQQPANAYQQQYQQYQQQATQPVPDPYLSRPKFY